MATGLEDAQRANLTAQTDATSAFSSISDAFSGLGTDKGIDLAIDKKGTKNDLKTDLVGMNTDESSINAMISGIDSYTAGIKDDIRKIDTYASASAAFGSDVGSKVQEFTLAMKEVCLAIVSQLDRFKEDVKSVAAAYRAKGESVVTAVSSAASTVSSNATSSKYEYNNN